MSAEKRQAWETPKHIFDYFDRLYDFDCDVCADAKNAKVPGRWIGKDWDALSNHSVWGERNFCNPPYSNPAAWLAAAAYRAEFCNASTLILLNVCMDTIYYAKNERFMDTVSILKGNEKENGRIQFIPAPGIKASTNSKGQMSILITPWSVRAQRGPRIETLRIPRPKK